VLSGSFREDGQAEAVSHFRQVHIDNQPVNLDCVEEALSTSLDWGGSVTTAAKLIAFLRALSADNLFANPDTLESMRQTVATSRPDLRYGLERPSAFALRPAKSRPSSDRACHPPTRDPIS